MDNFETEQLQNSSLLVLQCGIPPELVGYKYLSKAAELYALKGYSFSDIYRKIAEQNNVQPKSVMRGITYAISQGFDVGENLSKMVGVSIPSDQLHNALVIAYLALLLKPETERQA